MLADVYRRQSQNPRTEGASTVHECYSVNPRIIPKFCPDPRQSERCVPLFYQCLDPCVKRCCSIWGLLLPSECVRAEEILPDILSWWPRPIPFAADRCGFNCKVIISTTEPAERKSLSPDYRASASGKRFKPNRISQDELMIVPHHAEYSSTGRASTPPTLLLKNKYQ